MKHRRIAAAVSVVASGLLVGIGLASPDRFSLKTPNGIAFSEFRGYDAWQVIAVSQPDDAAGCGSAPPPGCTKAILGNPVMIQAYGAGIPRNGQPVPDGAAMVKVEWARKYDPGPPYGVTVPGTLIEVSFMVKDSERFPRTNGWGYATFRHDAATDTWKAFGDSPAFANTCHECHTIVGESDFVYTRYAQR